MSPTPQGKLQLNTMATIDKERTDVKGVAEQQCRFFKLLLSEKRHQAASL
jgi:hypothetical protein